jgi:hypothetical protein
MLSPSQLLPPVHRLRMVQVEARPLLGWTLLSWAMLLLFAENGHGWA